MFFAQSNERGGMIASSRLFEPRSGLFFMRASEEKNVDRATLTISDKPDEVCNFNFAVPKDMRYASELRAVQQYMLDSLNSGFSIFLKPEKTFNKISLANELLELFQKHFYRELEEPCGDDCTFVTDARSSIDTDELSDSEDESDEAKASSLNEEFLALYKKAKSLDSKWIGFSRYPSGRLGCLIVELACSLSERFKRDYDADVVLAPTMDSMPYRERPVVF
jgi:hypothetical protein